ncbi:MULTISPECIES: amino acid permease [Parageobacillus]|uniref:amino acid permease n=1 Tax=Parageobacillus TaxID=1906945 RepID=UPI001FCB6A5B|nr:MULTISPECIES: amino acid permease [Parageobacillus]
MKWITLFISASAIAGILSVLFSFMLAGSRIWFAMSRDGLLPKWFMKVYKYKNTLLSNLNYWCYYRACFRGYPY